LEYISCDNHVLKPAICYFLLKHKQTIFLFCLQDNGTGDNSCIEEILRVGILKKTFLSGAILFTLKKPRE